MIYEGFCPISRGQTLRDHGQRPECLNIKLRHNRVYRIASRDRSASVRGMCATSPIYRGLWAPSPKRSRPPIGVRGPRAPMDAAVGPVWETVSLMEYVILIIVIAVLALGTGGWLLFVRPRRGRISAPSSPAVP